MFELRSARTPVSSVVIDGTNDVSAANTSVIGGDQPVNIGSLAKALAQIMGQSDVRWEKVARLQAEISERSYSVSSTEVANKLMRFMLG